MIVGHKYCPVPKTINALYLPERGKYDKYVANTQQIFLVRNSVLCTAI